MNNVTENNKTEKKSAHIPPNTDRISKMKESAQALEKENKFMDPGRTRQKPGPKPGSKREGPSATGSKASGPSQTQGANPSAPQPNSIPSKEIAKPILKLYDAGVCMLAYNHPDAAMRPEEFNAAAEALGMVMDKWMPNMAGPEMALGVILGGHLIRVMAMRAILKTEMEKAEKENAARGAKGATGIPNNVTQMSSDLKAPVI